MDSFTFELAQEVRDAKFKRRSAHKHAKLFNQLVHRHIKRSKELLKRSNELGKLNRSRKKHKKALHHIEKESIRWLSHREELMMKLENPNFRVKGEKKRGHVLVQKEVDKSLEKEAQIQQKIAQMDSFTFELAQEVRDTKFKRRAAHKHAKLFNQLVHRRIKRSKELLKRLNELG